MSDKKKDEEVEDEEEEEEEDDSIEEKKSQNNKNNKEKTELNNVNNNISNEVNITEKKIEKEEKNDNNINISKSNEEKEEKEENEENEEKNITSEEKELETNNVQKEEKSESNEMKFDNKYILFDRNKIKKYWKNQIPPKDGPFLDQLFPPRAEILYDKKMKNDGVEKINIHNIDFRKSTELFKKKDLTLFPPKNINTNEINFEINLEENNSEIIHDYSHFFHAIKILTKIPGLIPQIFKSDKVNLNGFYELYIYTNGQFKILILDDYFPIIKGSNLLRFAKPVKSELWLLLMEKAFAKLNGGYGALFSCNISHVIQTFTGFPIERLFFYDLLDIEDLEDIIRINKNINIINLCPKQNISEEIGLMSGRAYLVEDIFDIRNNNDLNGKEECIKILKLENLYESSKYKGDWSKEGKLLTDNIKEIVGYDTNDKSHIYMSIEYAFKYFEKIEIIYPLYDTNVKLIKINNNDKDSNIMNQPQIFNLYIPFKSLVSISLILRSNILDMETTNYEKDFSGYEKINPAMICYSKYDPDNQTFKYFEGSFNSCENPEFCRELQKGFYIIYAWVLYDKCNEPKPDEYFLKVTSKTNFKLRLQAQDLNINNNVLYNLIFNSIKLNQGQFMKKDEIFFMSDNNYNFTGLGLKFVSNPFPDCYQKWTFPEINPENMVVLYPPEFYTNTEIVIGPNNSHMLIYGIRLNSNKEGKFSMKFVFKTIKYNSNNNTDIKENKQPLKINFHEFCSVDVKNEKLDENYYQYLSLNPILQESDINTNESILDNNLNNNNKEIMDKLTKKYPQQMKRINELQLKISLKENSQLIFKELEETNGTFIGQVNSKDEKNGRGALILNESKNCIIGYWDNNIMRGEGTEYDSNWKKIAEGNYENGNMNGIGMKILDDGSKYEGMFLNGIIEGKGIYTFNDGSKWEGNSIKGKKEGKGILTSKEGNQSEVEYKNDIRVENNNEENNNTDNNNKNDIKENNKENNADENKEEEEEEDDEEKEEKKEEKKEEIKEESKKEEKKEEIKEENNDGNKEGKKDEKKSEKTDNKKDEENEDEEEEEEEDDDENAK